MAAHNDPDLRIAFFGTPVLAVWVLEELEDAGIVPSIVVTTPDKPVGRKLVHTPAPTKVWAETRDVPVVTAASLKQPEDCPELVNTEWDLFIVAAYGTLLRKWVLDLPRHGVLNVHPSLLPQLRGPSPIRSALMRDERDAVGVSIMELDEEMDHGPLVAQARVELPEWPVPGTTLDELLFREGGKLLAEVVPLWAHGEITPEPQDHAAATYTKRFEKTDGLIDLAGDPYRNYLTYCACDGWPGAYMVLSDHGADLRVKITQARYHDGVFEIINVVPEGKREMAYADFVRNRPDLARRPLQ